MGHTDVDEPSTDGVNSSKLRPSPLTILFCGFRSPAVIRMGKSVVSMVKFSSSVLISRLSQFFAHTIITLSPAGSAAMKVAKTAALKLFRRSDYKRWVNSDNYFAWWAARTEAMGRYIPEGSRVIEFGAGSRSLESYLAPNCSYIPSDLVDRGPGTVVCDLNKRPLPDLANLMAQVAVFAGVLEYLDHLPSLIEWLSGQVVVCVASYECIESRPWTARRMAEILHRASNGYMSYYTESQLIALFEKNGFVCTNKDSWRDQRLFVFSKSDKQVGQSFSLSAGSRIRNRPG